MPTPALLVDELHDSADLFGPVVYSYTRAQAIEDGEQVLVPEKISREAGFLWPVYLTGSVWRGCVEVPPGVTCQDEDGRLWDVLYTARVYLGRQPRSQTNSYSFEVHVRNDNRRPKPHMLVMQSGPLDIDDPSPAITIMLPHEI